MHLRCLSTQFRTRAFYQQKELLNIGLWARKGFVGGQRRRLIEKGATKKWAHVYCQMLSLSSSLLFSHSFILLWTRLNDIFSRLHAFSCTLLRYDWFHLTVDVRRLLLLHRWCPWCFTDDSICHLCVLCFLLLSIHSAFAIFNFPALLHFHHHSPPTLFDHCLALLLCNGNCNCTANEPLIVLLGWSFSNSISM